MFSIIIPAYNCEKTLHRTLESVASQTYTDWEAIVVNDGSKDGTLKVAESFSKQDKRIRVIDKKNAGVSSARNVGLASARGEFICFLDADDALPPMALSFFDNQMLEGIDLVIAGYKTLDEKDNVVCDASVEIEKKVNRDEAIKWMYEPILYPYLGYCWGKCFRSDIIKQFSLSFDERIYFNEDRLFVTQYVCCCNSINFISTPLYLYYQNPNSAMSSLSKGFNPKFMTDLDGFIEMKKSISKAGTTKENIVLANKGIASSYWRIQWMMNASSNNTLARFVGLHSKLIRNLPLSVYIKEVIMASLK